MLLSQSNEPLSTERLGMSLSGKQFHILITISTKYPIVLNNIFHLLLFRSEASK